MALKSTVYKALLNIADTDRQVYGDFPLTIARHPSETDQRMMLRVAAFALHADERLTFGRGISTTDEPDLWRKDLTGHIELWIELGNPDPDRLRKACGRSDAVVAYTYGDRSTPVWWQKSRDALERLDKLSIYQVSDSEMAALEKLCTATMSLQCTLTDGQAWLSDGQVSVELTPTLLKDAG
jgi:uncharacterized protein YaeQ